MRRHIVTGAPGAGKTTIITALRELGHAVVEEAATDVIAREQALGRGDAWSEAGFLEAVTRLQQQRQLQATTTAVFDRSPVCTLALARYLGLPVPAVLAAEVERLVRTGFYERRVFFVRLLGFMTNTAARRITLEQAARFEGFHEQAYLEHGFELIEVPAAPLPHRITLMRQHLADY